LRCSIYKIRRIHSPEGEQFVGYPVLEEIAIFLLVGFCAQIIDGTLGMAYGISATSFLLSLGIPPAVTSASVHAAEVITTGISAASHWKFGNVDLQLATRLAVPGVFGGIIGATLLVMFPSEYVRPVVGFYLLGMGVFILLKAFRESVLVPRTAPTPLLGFLGGALDASGGGGWGPIVVATLLNRGHEPRITVGSTNFAEFFVALAATATFVASMGLGYWRPVLGLALGGAIAAPFAAIMCKYAPRRIVMVIVALVIISLSGWTLVSALRAG
jgi:uncharacterized protein